MVWVEVDQSSTFWRRLLDPLWRRCLEFDVVINIVWQEHTLRYKMSLIRDHTNGRVKVQFYSVWTKILSYCEFSHAHSHDLIPLRFIAQPFAWTRNPRQIDRGRSRVKWRESFEQCNQVRMLKIWTVPFLSFLTLWNHGICYFHKKIRSQKLWMLATD